MLIAIESEYKMTIMNQTIRRGVACGATLLLLTGSAQAQTLEEPFHMPTMTDTSTLDIVIVEDWHAGRDPPPRCSLGYRIRGGLGRGRWGVGARDVGVAMARREGFEPPTLRFEA